jgi:pyridoxamine 5'-phosphate oxidase
VRIEGTIEKISKSASLKYFLSRPKGSQIGAWVSHQSRVVNSRSVLESKFEEIRARFSKGEIPFPDFWGGYIIKPTFFEFWQGGHDRLHDRFVFNLTESNTWDISRLKP